MATAKGITSFVEALVKADPTAAVAPNVRGRTALHLAAECGRDAVRGDTRASRMGPPGRRQLTRGSARTRLGGRGRFFLYSLV